MNCVNYYNGYATTSTINAGRRLLFRSHHHYDYVTATSSSYIKINLAWHKWTSISCCWQTCVMRCIMANVLQTKVDAHCDKLATDRSWQRLWRSKFANFNVPHLHLAPPLGVALFQFCWDLWRQKTGVPGLSCGVLCLILRLAISVEYWLVADRQTHDYGIYHTSMVLCGEKYF